MKKNSTNYAIKMLGLTAIVFVTMLRPAFCQVPAPDFDVYSYTMTVSTDQQVKFRLPKDIRSGDMITGSVTEENKSNAGAVNKNSSTLEGMVIEIDGKQTKINNRLISFIVPAGLTSLPFLLKNSAGQVIERGQIPVGIFSSSIPNSVPQQFVPEVVSQPGQTLRIAGTFDGNAANTNVSLNGQPMQTIAESPRMTYVQVPENTTAGVSNISIEENKIKEDHKINIAKLELSAPKTNLQRGEKTTIKVTVSGLEGLTQTNINFKLSVQNLSPQTISFLKEGSNVIEKNINTGNIKHGKYEFSTKIIALTAGVFTVSADLMDAKDDCIKRYTTAVEQMESLRKEKIEKCAGDAGCIASVNKMVDDANKTLYEAFIDCMNTK